MESSLLQKSISYEYPFLAATSFPSKQTATQLKGRMKDQEAAENAAEPKPIIRHWRKPAFAGQEKDSALALGNAVHCVMQYIRYENCTDLQSVKQEICRMVKEGMISEACETAVDPAMIWEFFATPLGQRLRSAEEVLREFKFSILDSGVQYDERLQEDSILLQGVVDCAIIEPSGITVLDFKTDRVTEQTLMPTADSYRLQVRAYANALSRIFGREVVSAQLYFFRLNRFVPVI